MDERSEAASPTTSAARLRELAASTDPGVQRKVASNPAVAVAVAVQLARAYPAEFLRNPSLPLWQLENPALLTLLPPATAIQLVRSGALTATTVRSLLAHPGEDVRIEILGSSLFDAALAEQAAHSWLASATRSGRLYRHFLTHPRVPLHVLEWLAEQPGHHGEMLALPHLPAYLRRHVIASAAFLPGQAVPAEARRQALRHASEEVRKALAFDPATPSWMLDQLARDTAGEVRRGVAAHERTSPSLRHLLRRDPENGVRDAARASLSSGASA